MEAMVKSRRIVAILMIMALIVTGTASMLPSAYAVTKTDKATKTTEATDTDAEKAEAEKAAKEAEKAERARIKALQPAKVTGVKAMSGYNSVKISWKAVKNKSKVDDIVIRYRVYRDNKLIKNNLSKTSFTDDSVTARVGKGYKYQVRAIYYRKSTKKRVGKIGEKSKGVRKQPVKPMFIEATTAYSTPYYSSYVLSSKNKVGTLKKGTTIAAIGGSHNKLKDRTYVFIDKKGNEVYAPISHFYNAKVHYTSKDVYTTKEKEAYINQRKLKSKTKYLIWANTYTQRVFIFKKKSGKWKLIYNWPANTGYAYTPSAYGVHKITSKYAIDYDIKGKDNASGVRYYNTFKQIAVHAKLREALGQPVSGGCIRVDLENARWVYENVPRGTTVVVY